MTDVNGRRGAAGARTRRYDRSPLSRHTSFMRRRGFTLIELLAGVAVIGVIATLAAPTMTDFVACQRLNATARGVASDVQLSRMRAIAQRVNHQVAFASNPPTYTLSRWDAAAGAYVPLKASQAFEPGVALGSADGAIVFQPYGASAGIAVTLDSSRCGKQKTVSVNTIGRVKIL